MSGSIVLKNKINSLDDETKTWLLMHVITQWGKESGSVYELKSLQELDFFNNDEETVALIELLPEENIKAIINRIDDD